MIFHSNFFLALLRQAIVALPYCFVAIEFFLPELIIPVPFTEKKRFQGWEKGITTIWEAHA
jgi:hypothetical protein